MDTNKLRELLDQLQNELNSSETLDEQGYQLLKDLDDDIQALLDRADDQSDDTFAGRLEDALYHFEATHPTLTVVISKVLDSLSGAGI